MDTKKTTDVTGRDPRRDRLDQALWNMTQKPTARTARDDRDLDGLGVLHEEFREEEASPQRERRHRDCVGWGRGKSHGDSLPRFDGHAPPPIPPPALVSSRPSPDARASHLSTPRRLPRCPI